MIKKLFNLFKRRKKNKSLVWLHIHTSQNRGVIGWLAHDKKTFGKGEDNFDYKGILQRIVR